MQMLILPVNIHNVHEHTYVSILAYWLSGSRCQGGGGGAIECTIHLQTFPLLALFLHSGGLECAGRNGLGLLGLRGGGWSLPLGGPGQSTQTYSRSVAVFSVLCTFETSLYVVYTYMYIPILLHKIIHTRTCTIEKWSVFLALFCYAWCKKLHCDFLSSR